MNKKLNETDSGGAFNAAGSGGIAGIGVGPQGEPGVKRKKLRNIILNKTPLSRINIKKA